MKTYIGIDNGLSGAIAIIDEAVTVHKTPTINGAGTAKCVLDEPAAFSLLGEVASNDGDMFACIERVQAMPKQGLTSACTYGVGHGLWRGMLVALGIPYAIVDPRTWQRLLLRDVDKRDTKAASIIVAKRLFPRVPLRRSEKCRVDDHNMADALLLAEYAQRIDQCKP